MIFRKTIINTTTQHLTVGIVIRNGSEDVDSDNRVLWTGRALAPGERMTVDLANSEAMPFVNGLWVKTDGQAIGVGYRTIRKSDTYDDTLNMNDTLAICSVSSGGIDVRGSNH